MNSLYKKISLITIFLFFTGIVGIAYYLYQVSANLTKALQIRESNQIELIEQTIQPVSVAVGIEIFLGVSAILFLLLNKGNTHTSINLKEDTEADFSSPTSTFHSTHIDKRVEVIQNKLQAVYSDEDTKLEKVLNSICNELDACQGAIFQAKQKDNKRFVEMRASYAYFIAESKSVQYEFGEGLTGQVAKEGKLININTVPDGYVTIISGLGNSTPKHLIIAPVMFENIVVGVIEIASFRPLTKRDEDFLDQISPMLGKVLVNQSQEEAIA